MKRQKYYYMHSYDNSRDTKLVKVNLIYTNIVYAKNIECKMYVQSLEFKFKFKFILIVIQLMVTVYILLVYTRLIQLVILVRKRY